MKNKIKLAVCFGLCTITLCCSTSVAYGANTNEDFVLPQHIIDAWGDTDLNRVIDIKDATNIQKYLAEVLNSDNILNKNSQNGRWGNCDFDGDGNISINDVTQIQNMIADKTFVYNHTNSPDSVIWQPIITVPEIPFDRKKIESNKFINRDYPLNESPSTNAYNNLFTAKAFCTVSTYEEYLLLDEMYFNYLQNGKTYDKSFFEENSLVINFSEEKLMSFTRSVEGMFVKDSTLYLYYHYYDDSDNQPLEIRFGPYQEVFEVSKKDIGQINKIAVFQTETELGNN